MGVYVINLQKLGITGNSLALKNYSKKERLYVSLFPWKVILFMVMSEGGYSSILRKIGSNSLQKSEKNL